MWYKKSPPEVGTFEGFKLKIFNELKLNISDEKFIARSRLFGNRLTRQRALPFHLLVWFILQKTNQSLQVCLDSFFDFHQLRSVSKSALTQARANLCPKVFKQLNGLVAKSFYESSVFKKWKDFRVLAVDGSTLQLPGNHPSLKKKFSHHLFGPKADAGHWMSRISYLYDVFNGLVLDAAMESYTTSESSLCNQHMSFIKKGDLVLFDRYYASFERMFLLSGKGAHFVFRMKDNWWNCVDNFVNSGLDQQMVCLRLPVKFQYLLEKYPHLSAVFKVRLIKKTNRKGETQVFCTSLTDTQKYSRKAILNLYKQRWGIEEAYKLIKCRLEVADFSGLTAWAIQQDFYAKTLLITLSNVLCFGIKPKPPKKQSVKRAGEKRIPIINRTYAIHHLKVILTKTAFCIQKIEDYLKSFLIKISSQVEYSRRNQSVERKFKPCTKFAMNYKVV